MEHNGVNNNNNGSLGFHGYCKLSPKTTSSPDITIGLPPPPPPPPENNHHAGNDTNTNDTECIVREQDRLMPLANVIRIMRKVLPQHAKISTDAKETVQECVSEFIGFITGEANARCQHEHRKTITAEDVLWAMSKLGFDNYIEPLYLYLQRSRESDGGEHGSLRGDSVVNMVADPSRNRFPGISPTAFQQMAAQQAFFGVAPSTPMNSFFNEANGDRAGTSQAAFGYSQPFPPCKEYL